MHCWWPLACGYEPTIWAGHAAVLLAGLRDHACQAAFVSRARLLLRRDY